MQTINRNNYEEYFLLYADDELDAATKLAVENFIQQHTDLAVELNMLMQTRLKPEEVLFDNKESLMHTEGNSINETNHEEYFLLYIDNELSAAKRAEVETYVLQHPALQNEFTGLKQAVLPAENISYGNKENLYRTEKRRTVYLKPLRLAAAAILIGVCAVGIWLWQKPASTVSVAKVTVTPQQAKQNAVVPKQVDSVKQDIPVQQNENSIAQQSNKKENKIAKAPVVLKHKTETIENNKAEVVVQHPSIQKENVTTQNDKPVNIAQQNNEPKKENTDVAMQTSLNKKEIIQPTIQTDNNNNYKVYDVAYKEINTSDDDNSLHVGTFELNKNKVKNLLKKAGRLFSHKLNTPGDTDGKLQVANFEINTINQ